MWKKQDDTQPDFPSKERNDAAKLLGDALGDSSRNEELQKRDLAVESQRIATETSNQPSPAPTMKAYTEAVKEFTKNASTFMEQLPLFTKARESYAEAMKASAEMRKVLDAGDEDLRTLMAQLEEKIHVQELGSATDKKPPAPANFDRMKAEDRGDREFKWP